MSSWLEIASFAFMLLSIPLLLIQLWAFTWPNGKRPSRGKAIDAPGYLMTDGIFGFPLEDAHQR
ncbi:hypothetical protein OIDMADRAFT_47321 [Oidiodendron maius Zn]|uniref:Uncharacterized protein n=1 Tax=Oidiodendron maius (strain Zn) TaxID=913774 RepID=A0A0C3DZ98_OIDMZ|nr:hypothetical protein OIDMADRAFT_47321 [Oidiodendron maius Zn]